MAKRPTPRPAAPKTANSQPVTDEPPLGTRGALLELARAMSRDIRQALAWLAPRLSTFWASAKHQGSGVMTTASSAWKRRRRADPTDHPAASIPPAAGVAAHAPTPTSKPRLRQRLLLLLAAMAIVFMVGLGGIMAWALNDVPFDRIAAGQLDNQVIALTASDGQPMIQRGPYQEVAATRDQFPAHLVEAVLAIEDRRFFQHWGVDLWGITRALGRNLFAGEVREGGSTITQQLLKILYLDTDRTVRRKAQELFLSLWLENRLSKDEILALYLNNVYLGAGATGMPAAARVYFDKDVATLTVAESAMLAGLIAAPSALNPLENLDGAQQRTGVVLQAMQSVGYLDDAEAMAAQLNSAQLQPKRPSLGTGTWFADWAMQEAQETSGQFLGSVKVVTTLVPDLQFIAEQSVRAVMAEASGAGASQAAMVVLAPDGAVLAMVGGLDYAESEFNRALAMRQPGSTFKLFTYYAALKLGAEPDTRLQDSPIEIDGWTPQNIDGEFAGRVSLAEAFARSLNVATVQLGMDVGLGNVVAAARELGIDAPLQETPSLILGASEVTLLDITGAYASVRAGLAPIEPYGIATFEAPNGRPFTIGPRTKPSVELGESHAAMLGLLQLVVDRGTGQEAQLDRPSAGKTGTSQDYRDAWFVGFDANYTVGVWVGNDDGTPMDRVTGGQLPAQIFKAFMTDAVPPARGEGGLSLGIEQPDAGTALPQCNIQQCSRAYRSFRASDCTFQPYSGPRRLCEK